MPQVLVILIFFFAPFFPKIFYNKCNTCETRGNRRYVSPAARLPSGSLDPQGSLFSCPSLSSKAGTGLISSRVRKPIKSLKEPKAPQCLVMGTRGEAPPNPPGCRQEVLAPGTGGREAGRPGGSQRPGGVVSSQRHKAEALKGPRTPRGCGPATPTPTTLQEDQGAGRGKRDPLLSPGAGFLSAGEVSNVRSPPPRIPSGGRASHFPFRKGQNKRPVKHIEGKSRSGPSPGPASCSPRAWPSPAGEVPDARRLTWAVGVL